MKTAAICIAFFVACFLGSEFSVGRAVEKSVSGTGQPQEQKTVQTKDEVEKYKQWAEEKLNQINRQIEELKMKSGEIKKEAKAKFNQQVDQLEKKQKAAQRRLDQLKKATRQNWKSLKSKTDKELKELEDLFKQAKSRFQQD